MGTLHFQQCKARKVDEDVDLWRQLSMLTERVVNSNLWPMQRQCEGRSSNSMRFCHYLTSVVVSTIAINESNSSILHLRRPGQQGIHSPAIQETRVSWSGDTWSGPGVSKSDDTEEALEYWSQSMDWSWFATPYTAVTWARAASVSIWWGKVGGKVCIIVAPSLWGNEPWGEGGVHWILWHCNFIWTLSVQGSIFCRVQTR